MPAEGRKAPAFSALDGEGAKVSLSVLKGKPVVLYFYPKDDTPGCTVEAKGFRDQAKAFAKLGVTVLGVSPDDAAAHCKFTKKHGLNFPLLCDVDHTIAEKYGVWVEKSMYGKKYMGVQRATFLIGADGKVAKAWPKVKPEGHAEEVLAAAAELAG
ncbi:MAG: thioredoxin-dependent thiol peroxidase [Candidatus Hydrogenedens sp.]|nr:thioredoxin-dependent thiol peroxidase [Candidatus Hydrogenedens sp.]